MIISEKQIMQLIELVRAYATLLSSSQDMMKVVLGEKVYSYVEQIVNQQSEELKVIK